jgi:hypothetical protein
MFVKRRNHVLNGLALIGAQAFNPADNIPRFPAE